ncbi:MAG: AAA family ATPase, partial [Mariprofundaceae bacterium]|nr:AAA family ATPase [Mariprofundaceae bacterium]
YRMIDTMSDVAFLVMDCDARARPDLGFRFLSRYLECSGDYDGLSLLSLYLSYRAGVRGKVACLLSDDHGIDAGEKTRQQAEAARYFDLAESYALPSYPRLFATGGLSGSGKSRLALLGCGIERAIIIRSDATRKRVANYHTQLDLYGAEMNVRTYKTMFTAAKTALAAGFSVILDATFLRWEDREHIRQLVSSTGVESRIYWLDVDKQVLRKHIRRRMRKKTDASDANLHVLDMQLAHYRRPQEVDIRFVTSAEEWPEK